jgi:non-heme chloroperoxidase
MKNHNTSPSVSKEFVAQNGTAKNEYITTEPNVNLRIRDYGKGKPVILIHGWPLSNEMWEYQIEALVNSNCRVIAYDRRGFGKSSQPWNGYDYDTMTDDLKTIIDALQLSDITLVGFSMGGGEVVRYFSRYGGKGVSKAILVSSVTPYLLKTEDNPEGTSKEKFDATEAKIKEDRLDFLDGFGKDFFGVNLLNNPISSSLLDNYKMLASLASPHATLACAKAFSTTDFREEMTTVNVPTLLIHGDQDKTVPIAISSKKAAALIPNSRLIVYEGAPHGLFFTHKEKLNEDLIAFIHS